MSWERHRFSTPQIVHGASGPRYSYIFLPLLLLWLLTNWLAYDYGRGHAGFDSSLARDRLGQVKAQLRTLEREKEQMLRTLASRDREVQVQREAEIASKEAIKALQEKLMDQDKKLLFLRGVASGKLEKTLLTINNLEVSPGQSKGSYRLSFAVGQAMAARPKVEGRVAIDLLAVDGQGRSQVLPFDRLALDRPALDISFRHVQKFDLPFRLPHGLKPVQWEVQLLPSTQDVSELKERFEWKLVALG